MKPRTSLLSILGLCALPIAALAQDSTGKSTGLPGDAVDPHLASEQANDFVVDLAGIQSSAGRAFGVAPLIKASASYSPTPQFFNAQVSASSISSTTRVGVPFARAGYMQWSAAGFGVNDDPTLNDPGTVIDTSNAVGNQFGVTFAEFSSDPTATISFNNVVTGVVNYETGIHSRLYVSRIMAAQNSADWNCNVSQFGMGSVDSDGNTIIRADGFGSGDCGGFLALTGNNYYRVNVLLRNLGSVNVLETNGPSDAVATTWLLQNSTTTHSPANVVPAQVTGGAPILLGSNFSAQFVFGSTFPLGATSTHLAGSSDQRGTVSYSPDQFSVLFPGTAVGTAAMLGKNTDTDAINVWGLAANGSVSGSLGRVRPAAITDNDDGFTTTSLVNPGPLVFGNYQSQAAFRGGNGQVAVGADPSGNLIVAAQLLNIDPAAPSTSDEGENVIAVAKIDPTNGNTSWTLAAWCSGASGKAIFDAGGAQIGNLVELGTFATATGPSLSSPMIDSRGNILFTAAINENGTNHVALLRAIYDEVNFSYRLERVVRSGLVVHGPNSNTDYLIRFIELADSNSIDSSATFSSNLNHDAAGALSPQTLTQDDPKTVGGVVLAANIIYDTDGDGLFTDIGAGGTDQDYDVLLYVAGVDDCNQNGVPDDLDIADGTSNDFDGNGVPDECAGATSYCFGDGTGGFCPCGNFGGPGQGCANSTGQGGLLTAAGTSQISAGDLVLQGFNLEPNQPGLFFQGNNQISGGNGIPFGDGLRCAGGGVVRIQVRQANAQGSSSTTINIAQKTGVQPGDVKRYQLWYRNPNNPIGSPCGTGFNLTNGLEIAWTQ